jgi:hypothetical protein
VETIWRAACMLLLLLPEPPGGLKLYYNVGELKKRDPNLIQLSSISIVPSYGSLIYTYLKHLNISMPLKSIKFTHSSKCHSF